MESWATRRLFPAMGLIPIDREQARRAVAALEVAAGVLGRGDVLGIYPEGTRSRDGLLHRGHTGVAQLALMSGAPIVPVGLVGTDHIQPVGTKVPRPFRGAVVRFGEPLDPAAYGGSARRRRQLLTDDLMEAIRRLSGQQVSDDFASPEPPLVRGGTESVYQVHTVGGVGASWGQAARFAVGGMGGRFHDGRVGSVRRLGCRVQPDGTVRFDAEVAVSVKFQPTGRSLAMSDSTYHVIELIGSSSDSWELAAQNAVREAAKAYKDLRVAEVVEMDVLIENGAVIAYRTKLRLSYKHSEA